MVIPDTKVAKSLAVRRLRNCTSRNTDHCQQIGLSRENALLGSSDGNQTFPSRNLPQHPFRLGHHATHPVARSRELSCLRTKTSVGREVGGEFSNSSLILRDMRKVDGWGANNEGQIDLPAIAVEFQAMAEFV